MLSESKIFWHFAKCLIGLKNFVSKKLQSFKSVENLKLEEEHVSNFILKRTCVKLYKIKVVWHWKPEIKMDEGIFYKPEKLSNTVNH